jgi:hypothetical protein
MSQFRNVSLGLLALVCLASSAQAGNLKGQFSVDYLGPGKSSGAINGIGGLVCQSTTNCSFTRAGIVTDGESHVAIILESTLDIQTISVRLLLWGMEACQPDPTAPDFDSDFQNLTLPTAGRWIIHFNTETVLPAGTTFSQEWIVGTDTSPFACGGSFCINSVSGQPIPAPFDCDAM